MNLINEKPLLITETPDIQKGKKKSTFKTTAKAT